MRFASIRNKILCLLAFTAVLPVSGQNVIWKTHPQYSFIEPYSDDIWKEKNEDGKEFLLNITDDAQSSKFDSITYFSGDYALGLNSVDSKYRIVSIINRRDLKETSLSEVYYANPYSYFSEGRLSVTNDKDLCGYLNVSGDIVIKCKYAEAKPFYEGRALITQKNRKSVSYINDIGKTVSPIERDEDSLVATLEPRPDINYNTEYSIYEKNGLYGFKNDTLEIVHAQFKKVYPVIEKLAVVQAGTGLFGIISIEDKELECHIDEEKELSVITLPANGTRAELYKVLVKEDNGLSQMVSPMVKGDSLSFELPLDTAWIYKKAEIFYDGLLLSSVPLRDKTPKVSDAGLKVVSFYCNNARDENNAYRADKNNNIIIYVRVSNDSGLRGEGKVSMIVDGAVYNSDVSIYPWKKENIRFTIRNVVSERSAKIRVKLSNGKQTSLQTMHFVPFY